MTAHASRAAPLGGVFWDGGAETFINKGVNGRWRDTLSLRDVTDYETRSVAELGPICARWLAGGVRAV
jgi:aryl sulfotransferase